MADQVWRALSQGEIAADAGGDAAGDDFGRFRPKALVRAGIALARRTVLRRGAFRSPVAHLLTALNGGAVDIGFRGACYRVGGDRNLIEYGLLLVPEYNATEIDFLLRDAPEDAAFVDIGCNVGLYALPLAVARPAGRVVAVDANPRMVAHLERNARFSAAGNLRVLHSAVSDVAGRADLSIRKNDVAIVAITETPDGQVPVRRLADILADAGVTRIFGLKIDIEGHEDRALAPFLREAADAALPRRIVIEKAGAAADHPACAAAMLARGYRLEGRTRNNSCYRLD